MECFKCGVSEDRALLFDAISKKGIVKICRKCSFEEDIPIIKKFNLNHAKPEIRPTVRQRLSNISGVDLKDKKSKKEKDLMRKQETSLRAIVDKNFESKIDMKLKPRTDLIDNFHWIIMRVRRSKKITQKQLAEAIEEPEAAIKMAEQGILPEDCKLVNKLENYLGIRLVKEKVSDVKQEIVNSFVREEIIEQEQPQTIDFDSETTKTLTISDLQEMKRKKESEILEGKEEGYIFNKEISLDKDDEEKPEFVEKENLSQEEVDDILFGRKGS